MSRHMRALLAATVLLLASCQAQGQFLVEFSWANGQPPADIASATYMYAAVEQAGTTTPVATAGPVSYVSGATLPFAAVPTGNNFVVNVQLRDSAANNAQVIAYGVSQTFNLPPGQNVTVVVPLTAGVHDTVAVPPAGSPTPAVALVQANGKPCPAGTTCSINSTVVALELTAGAGAVAALLSNTGTPTLGATGTKEIQPLTKDAAAMPPAGFTSWRTADWDLTYGVPAARQCTTCPRDVFVAFLDSNNVASAAGSTTIQLNIQTPTLVSPTASPNPAGIGETLTIVATPSEQLEKAPIPHVYAAADTAMTAEIPGYLTLVAGSSYTFTHIVQSTETSGSFVVTFDLVDVAGNSTTYGQAGTTPAAVPFTIDALAPAFSAVTVSGGAANEGLVFSECGTAETNGGVIPPACDPAGSAAYNVITVSFDLNKPLATQGTMPQVTGAVGTTPMTTCTGPQGTGPYSYECSYTIEATDTAGTQVVLLTATDSAGNSKTWSQIVTFDFEALTLTAQVSPNPAAKGASPILSLTAGKPLGTAPGATNPGPELPVVMPAGVLVPTTVPDGWSGAGTAWALQFQAIPSVDEPVSLSLTAFDDVGHRAATSPSLVLEAIVPGISGLQTMSSAMVTTTQFSEASGYNQVIVAFTVAKALQSPADTLAVQVGGHDVSQSCMATPIPSSTAVSYLCSYTVQGPATATPDTSGSKPVTVTTRDAAGNTDSQTTSVVFDLTPISITPRISPNAALAGAQPVLVVTSSKVLGAPPGTTTVAPLLPTQTPSGVLVPGAWTGQETSWTLPFQAVPSVQESVSLSVTAYDEVGHSDTESPTPLVIDGIIPTISGLQSESSAMAPIARFSEVSGYNQVNVVFTVAKALQNPGDKLTVLLGGHDLSPGCTATPVPASTAVSYLCSYTVQGPGSASPDSSGSQPVTVTTLDAAGNTDSQSISVVFDLTPLSITPQVSPNPAGVGSQPVLVVTSDKVLGAPPGTTTIAPLLPTVTPSGDLVPGGWTGQATSWTLQFQSVTGIGGQTFGLSVTAYDDVGHSDTESPAPLVVDGLVPTISGVTVTPTTARFSAVAPYNTVTVSFEVTKTVQRAAVPAPLTTYSVTLGGLCVPTPGATAVACLPFACQTGTPGAYSCTYTVTGQETDSNGTPINTLSEGSLPVLISGVDEAGNAASAAPSVTFDFQPPSLVLPPTLSYVADPAANVLPSLNVAPGAATTNTAITVGFTVSELLSTSPGVTTLPAGLTFTQTVPAPTTAAPGTTSFIFDVTMGPPGSPADGAYGLSFSLTDLVGNPATITIGNSTVTLPQAQVLTAIPGAPDTSAGGPISYTRVPWGDQATAGLPSYSLAGSAAAGLSVAGNADAGVSPGTVVVFDSPNLPSAGVLGHAAVASDGSFGADGGFPLINSDHPVVYVAVADSAGNLSPMAATHNVSWTAAFNGKVSGSTVANPHVMLEDTYDTLVTPNLGMPVPGVAWAGVLSPSSATVSETASYAALGSGSASRLTTTAISAPWVQPAAAAPPARCDFGMAYDSVRGVTVIFGGSTQNSVNLAYLNDTWEWNGTSWTQESPANSPVGREGFAMSYDSGRGVTVLFGGLAAGLLNDLWEWNGTDWTQRLPDGNTNGPIARWDVGMAYDSARGVTVLFGGNNEYGQEAADTWEWDGAHWTQPMPAVSPPGRQAAGMAYDSGRGVTVLFGGYSGSDLADTWEWDGVNWALQSPATSATPREYSAMAYDSARGLTVLFGGYSLANRVENSDTWEWDGSNWNQRSPSAGPAGRQQLGMAYDSARGVTVLFAGLAPTASPTYTVSADTWEWNGLAWTSRSPPAVPTATSRGAMAYDSARGNSVFFGGEVFHIGEVANTWLWDGATWTEPTPANSPTGRAFLAMAYDSSREVTVLFGGTNYTESERDDDTWEWDGTNWNPQAPANSPPGRFADAMAYDSARGVTVLFGGYGNTSLNDTWEWDGTNWNPQSPANIPPARLFHMMAYDSGRGVSVLFGGYSASGILGDTWEWNGTNWTQASPATSPPALYWGSMAYDAERGVTVLYGGSLSSGEVESTTWEWNGTTWTLASPSANPPGIESGAMAYDSVRGAMVLLGTSGDIWQRWAAAPSQAVDFVQFDFAASGETFTSAALQQMSVSLTAGGTGYTDPLGSQAGALVPGAVLASWDVSGTGAWRVLGANGASAGAPAALSYSSASPWRIAHDVVSDSPALQLAVFPSQPSGNGQATSQVALADPELIIQYQHSESLCTVTSQSPCVCASDETVCGSLCSDLAADPKNCGACGNSCAGGAWCIGGACGCPPAEASCNGVCTDISQDPDNCGGCGNVCGPFRSCQSNACSACQVGQSMVGGSCVSDLAIRGATNQAGGNGSVSLTLPPGTQVGDTLIVVATPADAGSFTAGVTSGSGASWTLAGLGDHIGQYLAVYLLVAQAGDLGANVTVTMSSTVDGSGENLNATLLAVYSQSGASVALDTLAFAGAPPGGSGTTPGLTIAGPNELVLVAAAQAGTTAGTVPAGVTILLQSGGFVIGSYPLLLPGAVPGWTFTGGNGGAAWELAQIALASGAR